MLRGSTRSREGRVYDETYSVTNLSPDALLVYVRNRDLTPAARNQLQPVVAQEAQIAETQRAADDADKQIGDFTRDEDRIRRNIESPNNVSGQQQVQSYPRQLDSRQQQLAGLEAARPTSRRKSRRSKPI